MSRLGNTSVTSEHIFMAAQKFGTPFYLYDEQTVLDKCHDVLKMPNAFGLSVSYAMKANSSRALLQLITGLGIDLDLSSLNEGKRAHLAGIPCSRMMLTTQDVPLGPARKDLEEMILKGMRYNVCSLRQLELIADFAVAHQITLSIRLHPGVGAGESVTRNTGDKYSCFGIHLSDIEKAMALARQKGVVFDQVHVHIGSGGDPELWRSNIDRELSYVEKYLPDVKIVNLGGGFKEARMPDEKPVDIQDLGLYASNKFHQFHQRTGRKLVMAVEPGTYIVANAGFIVTSILDKKSTGEDGFNFLIADAGMEANSRPLLYGSRHPFFIISRTGELLSSEFDLSELYPEADYRVVVGRCCESGDSQSLDAHGHIIPRLMANPEQDDYLVIGGAGAYVAAMSLANYNSYAIPAEILLRTNGTFQCIRAEQILEQMIQNERSL
ncbi:diaminopimelate decarboxylase [candidate division KSB1 bacterium]|nr:diaminopimelate decarboxylase [candidate division KSB1 bacterium]RQW01796.1 MAG: diaminopimelate decarboxylase [candidate division KSB1 bacterium]